MWYYLYILYFTTHNNIMLNVKNFTLRVELYVRGTLSQPLM